MRNGFLFCVPRSRRWQSRQRNGQALAQVDGGVVDGHLLGLGPQVQRVAGTAAFEALKHVFVEVGREALAGP